MIVSRAAQGMAAGALIPGALTIVSTRLSPPQRPIGIALFGLTITMAPALGPTIGGWLTETLGWQYIFFINVAPAIAAMVLMSFGLESEPARPGELRHGDWPGIVLIATALGSITVVLEEGTRLEWLDSAVIRNLSVLGAVTLAAGIAREFLAERPFIDLRLLGKRTVGGACFMILIVGANMFGVLYIVPTYLAQVQHDNAEQIGSVLVWSALPQLFLYPLTAVLLKYVDIRILVCFGLVASAASSFLNAHLSRLVGLDQLIVPQILSAVGTPVLGVTLQYYTVVGLNDRDAASSSAMWSVCRNLGGTLGIAMLSTTIQSREHYHFSERITRNALSTKAALAEAALRAPVTDPALAHLSALARIAGTVRQEAFIMAYGDSFFLLGLATLASLAFVAILPRVSGDAAPAAGH
jgi:DHA2 family multidrug resistance protein